MTRISSTVVHSHLIGCPPWPYESMTLGVRNRQTSDQSSEGEEPAEVLDGLYEFRNAEWLGHTVSPHVHAAGESYREE